jgi:hypothetical protein
VNEAGWLTKSRDSVSLIDLLWFENSERKTQLFACACWRRLRHLLPDDSYRKAIEVSELRAAGQAEYELVRTVMLSAATVYSQSAKLDPFDSAAWSGLDCLHMLAFPEGNENYLIFLKAASVLGARREIDEQEPLRLFRDIFVKPNCPVTISPAVLAWKDGLVVQLAQTAYDERQLPAGTLDNGRLAVLADALEEVGCADADSTIRGEVQSSRLACRCLSS